MIKGYLLILVVDEEDEFQSKMNFKHSSNSYYKGPSCKLLLVIIIFMQLHGLGWIYFMDIFIIKFWT